MSHPRSFGVCNKLETTGIQRVFSQKKKLTRRETGDRFIPARHTLDVDAVNFYINRTEEPKDLFSQEPRTPSDLWSYRAGSLYSPIDHVFNFSTHPKRGIKRKFKDETNRAWPIRQLNLHNRPGKLRPDHVYDLPNFRNSFYLNIVDWSTSGYFAASLGNTVYTWNPFTFVRDTLGDFYDDDVATSLKWHPNGKLLALGTHSGYIKVCDAVQKKPYVREDIGCDSEDASCVITSLAWHPSETYRLAAGCSNGVITAMEILSSAKVPMRVIGAKKLFSRQIASLRFSSAQGQKGTFLAVGGRSDYVYILTWPSLESHLNIHLFSPCRALAWHPWKPSLLAIGVGSGCILVMNIMKEEILQSYKPNVRSTSCCLEWCPQSGLLISCHIISPDTTIILVLSSLNQVEQKAEGNYGRILYLLWSPDGSQIATAGSDEILRIWSLSKSNIDKGMESKPLLPKKAGKSLNFSHFIR